jgi:hypothetical protein
MFERYEIGGISIDYATNTQRLSVGEYFLLNIGVIKLILTTVSSFVFVMKIFPTLIGILTEILM